MIIPTDVTTLKNHDATSRAAFLSALLADDIFNCSVQFIKQSICFSISCEQKLRSGVKEPVAVPVSTYHLKKRED